MTVKVIRPLENEVSSKLLSNEGFLYAHLVKFEITKPIIDINKFKTLIMK